MSVIVCLLVKLEGLTAELWSTFSLSSHSASLTETFLRGRAFPSVTGVDVVDGAISTAVCTNWLLSTTFSGLWSRDTMAVLFLPDLRLGVDVCVAAP